MIYLKLLFTFFKIGLFSFGGGYAMIPLIEKEILINGWISGQEFADIIAIAEMTPGPVAVNSATFVGYRTANVLGAAFATLGVALPSLILILLLSRLFFKFQHEPVVQGIFSGIRPVIVGLIAGAAFFVAETSIFKGSISATGLSALFTRTLDIIDLPSVLIMVASIVALVKFKLNPILTIAASGATGILLFYMGVF